MKNTFSELKHLAQTAKGKVAVVVGSVVAGATSANAAIDPSTITLDTSPVEVLALTILGALGVIWVGRKVVSFLGR